MQDGKYTPAVRLGVEVLFLAAIGMIAIVIAVVLFLSHSYLASAFVAAGAWGSLEQDVKRLRSRA